MLEIKFRDGSLQKQCVRCRDWWPLTRRFWWHNGKRFHSWCRACCNEATARYRERQRRDARERRGHA